MEVCPCLQLFLHVFYPDDEPKPCIFATGLASGIVGDDRIGDRTTCRVLVDGCRGRGNVGKRRCFGSSLEMSRDREEPGWAIDDMLGNIYWILHAGSQKYARG